MKDQYLVVRTTTWERDSHGLFDFESRHVKREVFKVKVSGAVIREENTCKFVEGRCMPEEGQVLNIVEGNKEFHLQSPKNEKLWLVARHLKLGYKLQESDVIRLGRVKLRVKELNSKGQKLEDELTESNVNSKLCEEFTCRVCLGDFVSEKNPLICPCKCSGTMKYIHLSCLRKWLLSKMSVKQTGCSISYSWKQLACELCQVKLPASIKINNKKFDLVEITKPETPYVVLEDLRKSTNSNFTWHVVSLFSEIPVKLGRGHECEIRISDISVSRFHANLLLKNGGCYIQDNKSKFGTLLLSKKPLKANPDLEVCVQVNRTLFNVEVKKPFNWMCCLECCAKSSEVHPYSGQITNAEFDFPNQDFSDDDQVEEIQDVVNYGDF